MNQNIKSQIRLSGDTLKLIAAAFMLIDHLSYGLLHLYMSKYYMNILPQTYTNLNKFYEICRAIGHMAFPIFCFFIVEGFVRTSNVTKYAIRLFIFAVISEIPFDLGLYQKPIYSDHQNVIFSFFFAVIMLACIDYVLHSVNGFSETLKWVLVISLIAGFSEFSTLLKLDYSFHCILLTAALYLFREKWPFNIILGAAIHSYKAYAPVSFVFLYFYNPDVKPRLKYFFYIFYPLHLLIIYLIATLLFQ